MPAAQHRLQEAVLEFTGLLMTLAVAHGQNFNVMVVQRGMVAIGGGNPHGIVLKVGRTLEGEVSLGHGPQQVVVQVFVPCVPY